MDRGAVHPRAVTGLLPALHPNIPQRGGGVETLRSSGSSATSSERALLFCAETYSLLGDARESLSLNLQRSSARSLEVALEPDDLSVSTPPPYQIGNKSRRHELQTLRRRCMFARVYTQCAQLRLCSE